MQLKTVLRVCPLIVGLLLGACNSTPQGGTVDEGGDPPDLAGADLRAVPNPDAFWASDPPLMMCGADGVPKPPMTVPGGTPECPDDKNREGCPCDKPGMTAPCWPGLRANRNLGICKDGQTKCLAGEVINTWGKCEGYTLPTPGVSSGAAACQCFSEGTWKLQNLGPCFIYGPAGNNCSCAAGTGMNGAPCIDVASCGATQHCAVFGAQRKCTVPGAGGAISTVVTGGVAQCPGSFTMAPAQPWSTDSVKADCKGTFKLCYSIKAGDYSNPKATDCEITKVCVTRTLNQANQEQDFSPTPLPSWIATDAAGKACATAFGASGGYGEMSVEGKSVTCDTLTQHVFNRVKYCPDRCQLAPQNPETRPECQNCGQGGSGMF